jgi:excisionase family DNA binding protein
LSTLVSRKLSRRELAATQSLSVSSAVSCAKVIEMPSREDIDDLPTRIARRRNALTVTELADLLNLSANHIYDLVKLDQVPHYRLRGSIRFDPAKIARWLLEQAA